MWPENEPALRCFLAVQTQWRTGPMGGFLGLDYQGVHAALRMMKVKDIAALFEELRAMEAAALPILNAKRND